MKKGSYNGGGRILELIFSMKKHFLFNKTLAYRPAPRTFQLALRGYSVASLPRALHFALARVLRFALTKIFEKKKCVSIDSKCSETRKNANIFFLPLLTHYALRAWREVHENFRKKKVCLNRLEML